MAPKVLIADALSQQAADIFKVRGIDTDARPGLPEDELVKIIGGYDGIAVRSAAKVTANIINAGSKLKIIGRAGIGVDTVDVPAATARGIVVMNTPFGNSVTTAEHTIALLMALARHIPQANASTHAGKWEKSKFTGIELYGKTLGVIGCGNIGSIVADRALGLKMKVLAFDPFLSPARALELGVESVDLDTLYVRSDFITLHTPMLDSTRGMINAAAIAKMKKGVRLLNVARGGLIVEEDLKAALDSGHVAGAAVDVFVVEPAKENVLFNDPRVICTPHLGAATFDAQETVAIQIAEQMADYLLHDAVSNAVNMPSITAEEAPRLRPYIQLAQQLGMMAGQLQQANIREIKVTYGGTAAAQSTKPVTATLLAALLGASHESVNMVNARQIAASADIQVIEATQSELPNYQSYIGLEVVGAATTLRLGGTLFDGQPRLVELDDIAIEATLAGHMLLSRNSDVPGHIGRLGTVLGDAGINIATFHLGRNTKGGHAIALVAVDTPLSTVVQERVRALPGVIGVHALVF